MVTLSRVREVTGRVRLRVEIPGLIDLVLFHHLAGRCRSVHGQMIDDNELTMTYSPCRYA